jgi:hypothetical protein
MAPSTLQADFIKNLTTGDTIFAEDYERGSVGQVPGTNDPLVGTWYTAENSGSSARVVDQTAAGFAPYEGTQFFKLDRPSGTYSSTLRAFGVDTNSSAGDTIKMDLAFRVTGTETSIVGKDADGRDLFVLGLFGSGVVEYLNPGGGDWTTLTQTYNANAWNTLELTHINGNQGWSVSVNGATPETGWCQSGMSAYTFSGFGIRNDAGGSTGYFDAVAPIPEPCTATLSLTGLVGLLAYAWRKRK